MTKMFGNIATVECATGMSDEVVAEAKDIMRKREVPYFKGIENKCEYNDGDFWGVTVCPYHIFRDRFHGRKAPAEYHKPKCTLFNEWLKSDYTKCDACLQKCKEAKEDSDATD